MTGSAKQREQNASRRGVAFKLRPIAAACSTLLLAASTAWAQQAPATDAKDDAKKKGIETIDTVVVTGIRHAIETSVAIKKNSDSIVEHVGAEDIGKLPDVSIAESLARLPGLAAQRVDGRAQVLSIRGLAPKYGTTLLNGRELVSTGDNRSVEYDQFPSELINGATVYKTPDASLAGQGLSGTVDMQSVRPLDFRGRQVNLNLRGEKNSNGVLNAGTKDKGGRFSISYIDQFANNTIGLALGYAHLDAPGQEKHYKSWWWANTADWGAPLAGTPAGSIALQGFEAGVASTQRKRDGLMSVLEFRPNKNFQSTIDLYYSKFEQTEDRRTLMSDLSTWAGASYTNASTAKVNGDTIVTGGTISGVTPTDLSTLNKRDDKILAAGWNNKFKFDKWTAIADFSYSKAERDEVNAELQAGAVGTKVTFNNVRIPVDEGAGYLTPSVNYADAGLIKLSDPGNWGRNGRSQFPKVTDELKSFKFSGKRDLDWSIFNSIDAGVNYSDRTKKMSRTEVNYILKNGGAPITVGQDLLRAPADLSFAGINGGVLAFDFNGALARYYNTVATALDQAPGRIWDVQEKVTTGYVKLGFDFGAVLPFRGNVGLQGVRADQHSNGLAWDGSKSVPISGGKQYSNVLPSLNLVADLGSDAYVRFGAAKVMARPNMEDMRAGFSGISVGSTFPFKMSANGGNPTLEPWTANAYDLSFEKYFGKASYVSLAVFQKDLKTFVYNRTIDYDFTGFPIPAGPTPSSKIGNLSTQANGRGGSIDGIELAGAIEGKYVHKWLDGFGLVASASDTHSSLHEEDNPSKPLDGLSGRVYNTTFYYEKSGFSFRVAQRSRSKFTTTVRGTFGENVPSAIYGERIVDMQFGYAFETGPAKGLSILLQVNNLNDTPYRTAVGIATGSTYPNSLLPERYTTYGRQYLLGFTYKM